MRTGSCLPKLVFACGNLDKRRFMPPWDSRSELSLGLISVMMAKDILVIEMKGLRVVEAVVVN